MSSQAQLSVTIWPVMYLRPGNRLASALVESSFLYQAVLSTSGGGLVVL